MGGVSMSALASILKSQGNHVSGSDIHNSSLLEKLAISGIVIYLSHNEKNVEGGGCCCL